jgi:hypothetical protein
MIQLAWNSVRKGGGFNAVHNNEAKALHLSYGRKCYHPVCKSKFWETILDANISARFFRISAGASNVTDFPDLLLQIASKPIANREYDITETGVIVRLERCDADGEFIDGEFCRKQMTNIPPQAGPDGLTPMALPDGQGLGHLAAFRYHRPTRVILLQNNRQCVTTHRVALYVMRLNAAAIHAFSPILREDALERFKDKKLGRSACNLPHQKTWRHWTIWGSLPQKERECLPKLIRVSR